PALPQDDRFRAPNDRSKNRHDLNKELDRALGTKTSAEWVEILNEAGVPSGPILNVKEVFENEQVRHLGMATPVKHPKLGEIRVQNLPVVLSRTPGAIRTAAPEAGEHTDEVLGELGYSPEEIAALRRDKVV
ncbi:MAG: CoA transferase, partial [Candidatus Rokubacteria bacterium]|nr:CoA transferase [Candidatus Rokubacteria bacterium]